MIKRKLIYYCFLILIIFQHSIVSGQLPEPNSNPIDTSQIKLKKWLIEDETYFISLDSSDFKSYFKRGLLYMEINYIPEAIKDFTKCISLKPEIPWSYYYRGGCYDRMFEFNKAISDYNEVIKINPDQVEWAYLDRSTMYTNIEEYGKAETDAEKALELKPNWTIAQTNLGIINEKRGDSIKAIEYYKLALLSDSNNYIAFNNLGSIFFKFKDYNEAIICFDAAINILPNYFNAIRNRADVKVALGDKKGACEDLKLAASLGDAKAAEFIKLLCD